MDAEELEELYTDRYEKRLGLSFGEWLQEAPQTEDQAYERLQDIDTELKETYQEWYDASGSEKDELEDYRDRLKAEYELLEQLFGLELHDN